MKSLISEIQGHEYTPGLECYFPSYDIERELINKHKGKEAKEIFKEVFMNTYSIQKLIARTVILHSSKSKGSFNTYSEVLRILYQLEKLDLITDDISDSIVKDLSFIEPSFIHFSFDDDDKSNHLYYPLQSSIHKAFHKFDIDINEAIQVFIYYFQYIASGEALPPISNEVEGCLRFKAIDNIYKEYERTGLIYKNEVDYDGTVYEPNEASAYLILPLLIREFSLTREGRAVIFDPLYGLDNDIKIQPKVGNGEPNFKHRLDLLLLPNSAYVSGFQLSVENNNLIAQMKPIFDALFDIRNRFIAALPKRLPTKNDQQLRAFVKNYIYGKDQNDKFEEFIELCYLSQYAFDVKSNLPYPPRLEPIPKENINDLSSAKTGLELYLNEIIGKEKRYHKIVLQRYHWYLNKVRLSFDELNKKYFIQEYKGSHTTFYTFKTYETLNKYIDEYIDFVIEYLYSNNPSVFLRYYSDDPLKSYYKNKENWLSAKPILELQQYLKNNEIKGLIDSLNESIQKIKEFNISEPSFDQFILNDAYSYYLKFRSLSYQAYIQSMKSIINEIQNVYCTLHLYELGNRSSFIKDIVKSLVIYSRLVFQYRNIKMHDDFKQASIDVYSEDTVKVKVAIELKHKIMNYGYSDFVDIQLPYHYPSTNEYITGLYTLSVQDAYYILYDFYASFIKYENKKLNVQLVYQLPFQLLNFELFEAALVVIDRPIAYFAHGSIMPKDTKIKGFINGKDDFTKLDSYHEEAYDNKDLEFNAFSDDSTKYFRFSYLKNAYKLPKAKYIPINLIVLTAKRILTYWNCYFDYNYQ